MRAYDLLLRLYPASFRNEYGDELRALFDSERRQAGGTLARAGLWLAAIGDTVRNAALAHLDILRQDLRYTGRMLRRSPGFAATAILLVALGIGATAAAFSVTDFVLIRPLPFHDPGRLVRLMESTPGYPAMEFSAPNYRDWTGLARSYVSTGVYHDAPVDLTRNGEPRRLSGTAVSADLFPTLGVAPLIGRTFTPEDDAPGAPPTVILSFGLWQSEFGGDPAIVGQTLDLNSAPHVVRGVMPRAFHFPSSNALVWTTNRFDERAYADDERSNNWLYGIGRLRPGVTVKSAQAEMSAIAAQSERDHPAQNRSTGASVRLLSETVSERSRMLLIALSGAAACVLLIACANLANLLLARAVSRRQELAVRAAIGAGRERLVRQMITESLLVALAGGALGLVIAVAAVPLLARLVPSTLPIAETPAIDGRVLLFAVALMTATGLLFGAVPVMGSAAGDLQSGLREGTRGGNRNERLRSGLVALEVAASIVLLVSAGLLIRALLTIRQVDPGFRSAGVITVRSELPAGIYQHPARRQAFYDRVLGEVGRLPGVTSAGFISFLPMGSMRGGIWPVAIEGAASADGTMRDASHTAAIRFATPGYFAAMGIPLLRGQLPTDAEAAARPNAAVVSRSFVTRYWPDADPIGRRFDIGGITDREVVAVVGDVRFRGLESPSEPQVYMPPQQLGPYLFYAPRALVVRTSLDPLAQAPAVRAIVRDAEPIAPITALQTLDALIDGETTSRATQVRVVTGFALVAVLLAAVGIHGLLSFVVAQRTTEIGVRMALGASPRVILVMIMSRGFLLVVAGAIPGLLIAYWAGRSMEALLAGVRPADPVTLGVALALVLLMTLLGTLVPTLRAVRVDPAAAFRGE